VVPVVAVTLVAVLSLHYEQWLLAFLSALLILIFGAVALAMQRWQRNNAEKIEEREAELENQPTRTGPTSQVDRSDERSERNGSHSSRTRGVRTSLVSEKRKGPGHPP